MTSFSFESVHTSSVNFMNRMNEFFCTWTIETLKEEERDLITNETVQYMSK